MRVHVAAGMAALVLGVCLVGGCNAASTGPDRTSAPPDAAVVDILGVHGNRSFSPSPASVPAGRTVVWHNLDFNTHHLVFDGGGLDTGDITPGSFSAPIDLTAAGPYHCTIHPSMVGAVTGEP